MQPDGALGGFRILPGQKDKQSLVTVISRGAGQSHCDW